MYLITGGSGFCGFEIVKYLAAKGERALNFDIEPMPHPVDGVEFMAGDVRDPAAVRRVCKGAAAVIHAVAKVPISKAGRGFWDVNVDGTRNVLEVALKEGVRKVVHISSSAVQTSDKNPVEENAPYRPVGIYARSKRDAERVCLEYRAKGLPVDIIRPRTVLGPGRLGIFDIFFEWIAGGRDIYVIGNGLNRIQFLHVEDLAACCYLASQNAASDVFNVGSRQFGTLNEDLGALLEHAGTGSRIRHLPVWPSVAALAVLDVLRLSPLASWHYLTFHKDFYFSNENARRILNWKPRYANREILCGAYDDFLHHRGDAGSGRYGTSHRKRLGQGILNLVKRIS
jgi:nucleoside-diphosphate-sugar epimerase